jgi:hypothetical protein
VSKSLVADPKHFCRFTGGMLNHYLPVSVIGMGLSRELAGNYEKRIK